MSNLLHGGYTACQHKGQRRLIVEMLIFVGQVYPLICQFFTVQPIQGFKDSN